MLKNCRNDALISTAFIRVEQSQSLQVNYKKLLLTFYNGCGILIMMKKVFIFLIILAIVFVFAGCSAGKVVSDTFYSEYSYSDKDQDFVATGVKLSFRDNFKGFEFTMTNGISFMGETKKSLSGYSLSVSDDVMTSLSGLDELAGSLPEEYKELLDMIKGNMTANEQMFISGAYMFSASAITMIKSPKDKGAYDSLDGTYDYNPSSEMKYRFKNGYVYRIDITTKNNETVETEQAKPVLRYILQDRIIRMIRIDENGKDVYIEGKLQQTSYFYATVSYPKDFAESYEHKNPEAYEQAKLLAGKTLSVLTTAFYKA